MAFSIPLDWWRRQTSVAPVPEGSAASGRVAFRALVAFTVMLVASPQQYFPIPSELRIAFVFAALAVGAHLLDVLKVPRAARLPAEFKIVLALLALAVGSIPTSMWPGGSFGVLTDRFLKSVAIFWLLGSVITSIPRLRVMLWTLTVTSVPVALSAVRAYLSGSVGKDDRIFVQVSGLSSGLAANPNDLALLLCLLLPLTGALALTSERAWVRALAGGVIGLNVIGIMVTLSRAGLLMLVAEAALFGLLLWRRRRRKALTALVLAAALTAVWFPSGLSQRFSSVFGEAQDASAQLRQRDQVVAVGYILAHPIVGAGLGADIFAMDDYRGAATWTALHNVYLAYGVDLGAAGFGLFIALVVTSYRSARRVERSQLSRDSELGGFASGVRISLVGFMVVGFFAPVPYHFYFYYLSGLAVALKEIAAGQSGVGARA